jgi:menaquinone-dependent protoporphyrinogen oxidase
MARIAVVFGTTDGQSAKIARRIAEDLRGEGHLVDLLDTRAGIPATALNGIDAAVIAGSARMGKFQLPLTYFVQVHLPTLLTMPTAFVPVSLAASYESPLALREVKKAIERFTRETGLNANIVEPTAGALRYSRYGFFKKLGVRLIAKMYGGDTNASRDYEYTDWDAVDSFARHFADDVTTVQARVRAIRPEAAARA